MTAPHLKTEIALDTEPLPRAGITIVFGDVSACFCRLLQHVPALLAGFPQACPILLPAILALVGLAASVTSACQTAASLPDQNPEPIGEFLRQYCVACHGKAVREADLDLTQYDSLASIRGDLATWQRIASMIDNEQMPPPESPQPTLEQRETVYRWIRRLLLEQARRRAGDPGPVPLRRLSNSEYNYAVRDLTQLSTLNPTREFPVDSASGEGFTNSGSGQAMSPAMIQKYLEAGKQVAAHVVLLPQGLSFSDRTTRRDRTDQWLARIQQFYRRFTEEGGGETVNLQGIVFDTNQGGKLPVARYLRATLEYRDLPREHRPPLESFAQRHSLSPKYTRTLWNVLTQDEPEGESSFLISEFRKRWRATKRADVDELVRWVQHYQGLLWKFNSIGHLGRAGGPAQWMEAVSPLTTELQVSYEVSEPRRGPLALSMSSRVVTETSQSGVVRWARPRLVFPARPPWHTGRTIPLRDLSITASAIRSAQRRELARTSQYLARIRRQQRRAVDATPQANDSLPDPQEHRPKASLAAASDLNPELLRHWSRLLGFAAAEPPSILANAFKEQLANVGGYTELNGWGNAATPSVLANRSSETISFSTLDVPGRSIVVHPSPTHASVVTWISPVDVEVRIRGLVADADRQCGNGVRWQLEHRTRHASIPLVQGAIDNGGKQELQVDRSIKVRRGESIQLLIEAKDENHVCDTTHVQLVLSELDPPARQWNLSRDTVDQLAMSNPVSDSMGHRQVWYFGSFSRADPARPESQVPNASLLAAWRTAMIADDSVQALELLEQQIQQLLVTPETEISATKVASPDLQLRRLLLAWDGPLDWLGGIPPQPRDAASEYGLPVEWFGNDANVAQRLGIAGASVPIGSETGATDLLTRVGETVNFKIPAELRGTRWLAACQLLPLASNPTDNQAKSAKAVERTALAATIQWGPTPAPTADSAPFTQLLVPGASADRNLAPSADRLLAAFRQLFPPALCYARLVPVDEVVTLTLFHREDQHLARLMLTDGERQTLDRLWNELRYISREPLQTLVAFEQLSEFATQDRPDLVKAFAPLRQPLEERAAAFRSAMLAAEPIHVAAVLEWASQAWRRPLTAAEQSRLRELYGSLRAAELEHEAAIQLLMARILSSPAFLFKLESPGPQVHPAAVTDFELATRLSFFLWSSLPDLPLRTAAWEKRLTLSTVDHANGNPPELIRQTRRMLTDTKIRRLAIEFACQWLHLRDFDQNNDKNEQLYPEFSQLRGAMYEEVVLFMEDLIRENRPIVDLLSADDTFVNHALANHYGLTFPKTTERDWVSVTGLRQSGRGGILGMAAFLASQSGASRTSPILRGNWVYETLLGQRLPKPPADVPQLPEAIPNGLTSRQLIQLHSATPGCARCHRRIDPFGFALESFDAIGRIRQEAVDVRAVLPTGESIEGLAGLREYLLTHRRREFVEQFCRKLLGFALGREVRLTDEPWLQDLYEQLEADDYRIHTAIEAIVLSPQFRMIRGRGDRSQ